jgi:hypothetical protein
VPGQQLTGLPRDGASSQKYLVFCFFEYSSSLAANIISVDNKAPAGEPPAGRQTKSNCLIA